MLTLPRRSADFEQLLPKPVSKASTFEQLSQRHGFTRQTLYNDMKEGILETYKEGQNRMVSREAEEAWLLERRKKGRR